MNVRARALQLKDFARNHRKLLVFALVMFALCGFQFANAQLADTGVSAVDTVINLPIYFINLLIVALAVVYNVFAWMIGQLIVLMIGMVLIPILGYNNFADSNIISIGWPLVRDVVNMFVIIILLWIAIKTMVTSGQGGQGAIQSLSRLFLAVVALNFSRTICILIIDAGQVVMFTFVNALRDIAAGNFAGLFRVNSFLKINIDGVAAALSDAGNAITGETGLEAWGYLGTAYATVTLLTLVLVIMTLMAVVFIYRIVVLWVLVIMSPIAFFSKVAGPVLPSQAQGVGQQWWQKFTSAVVLGPVLTFFLWLALASAGQGGTLAAQEQFPSSGTPDVTGLLNEAFKIDEMLSLFIAWVLLVVGLQQSSRFADDLGGVAGKFLGAQGFGNKAARGIITAPARLTYRAGRAGVRATGAVGREGLRQFEGRFGGLSQVGKDLSSFSQQRLGGENAGFVSRLANAQIQRATGGLGNYARGLGKEARSTARDQVSSMSKEGALSELKLLSNAENAQGVSLAGQNRMREHGFQLLTDKQREKDLIASFQTDLSTELPANEAKAEAKRRVDQIKRNAMSILGDGTDYFGEGDDAKTNKKKWEEGRLRNLHLLEGKGDTDADRAADRVKQLTDILGDPDVSLRNLSTDAIADADVQEVLRGIQKGTKTDPDTGLQVPINAYDEVLDGKAGNELRNALRGVGVDVAKEVEKDRGGVLGNAVRYGNVQVSSIQRSSIEDGAGGVDDAKLTNLATALADSNADISGLDASIRGDVERKLSDLKTATTIPEEQEKYATASFSASIDPRAGTTILGLPTSGDIPADQRSTVVNIIREQPTQIYKFSQQISAGGPAASTGMSKQIAQEVTTTLAKKLETQFQQAQARGGSAGLADAANISESATYIREALEKEMRAATTGGGSVPRELQKKRDAFAALERYTA